MRGEATKAVPTIYLLRHSETVWNSLGWFQGQLDSPLTTRGIEQADHVARLLSDALCNDDQLFQIQISPPHITPLHDGHDAEDLQHASVLWLRSKTHACPAAHFGAVW